MYSGIEHGTWSVPTSSNHNRSILWFRATSSKSMFHISSFMVKRKLVLRFNNNKKNHKNMRIFMVFLLLYFYILIIQITELLNLHLNCLVVHCRGVSRQQFYMQLKRVDRSNMQNSL